jgi:hypothetical protein
MNERLIITRRKIKMALHIHENKKLLQMHFFFSCTPSFFFCLQILHMNDKRSGCSTNQRPGAWILSAASTSNVKPFLNGLNVICTKYVCLYEAHYFFSRLMAKRSLNF